MSSDPIREVMPRVSRALKRKQYHRARRLLSEVVDDRTALRAVSAMVDHPGLVPANTGVLTPAQWACVWNAACGLTTRQQSERFHRDMQTIASHRKGALHRLGMATMAGAVAECYRLGLFDPVTPLVAVDW